MSDTDSKWILIPPSARLSSDSFKASVKITPDSIALIVDQFENGISPVTLLNINVANPLGEQIDCYIRGNDLVLRFKSSDDLPLYTEIYFRVIHIEPQLLAIESIISLNTHSLNLNPSICVNSEVEIPANDSVAIQTDDFDRDSHTRSLSYDGSNITLSALESDYKTATVNRERIGNSERLEIKMQLASGTLEKGVIRRMRVLGFLSTNAKQQSQLDIISQFEKSAIPLTT